LLHVLGFNFLKPSANFAYLNLRIAALRIWGMAAKAKLTMNIARGVGGGRLTGAQGFALYSRVVI
jgi:hypothetical protein